MTALIALRLVLGGALILYALIVFGLRIGKKDLAFRRLGRMREAYGPRLGSLLHYFGYVIFPLILGVWLIAAAFGADPLVSME